MSPAVEADQIALDLAGIPHVGDIADEDGSAVPHFDRHVVEVFDCRRHRVGEDLVVQIAGLEVAGGNEHALPLERVNHIHRGQPARLQSHAVDVGKDASQLAAVDRRRDHALDGLQAVAQLEVGDVVELLLVHARTRHAHQAERNRCCRVERHDHRRDGARRQVEHVADRVGGHLAHGRLEADPFAEEVLDHADPQHGLGLLVLDADRLAGPALEAAHDVAFHHLRRHAGVEGHDLDGGCPEDGQQIGWEALVRSDAQHDGDQGSHAHRVWVVYCEPDHW